MARGDAVVATIRRLGALLAAGLVLVVTACTSGADAAQSGPRDAGGSLPRDTVSAMRSAAEAAIAATHSTGAVVGVWAPWSGSWTAGLGKASRGGTQPMTTEMRFRVGELTQAMTCTVLMRLAADGVVRLDDPVVKYLPEMVGIDDVTLAQACQSTSGIADYRPGLAVQFVDNPLRPYVVDELVSNGFGNTEAPRTGGQYVFSNTNYLLVGLALAKATGKSWEQLYEQYVFEPLGMSSSSFPSGTELPDAHPQGYAFSLDAGGKVRCDALRDDTLLSPSMAWTAGAVVSNLEDLHVFADAFARASLLTGDVKKRAWETVPLGGDAPEWQAFGMGGFQWGTLRGQAASIPGFATAMLSDPDSGLTVVVMLNNSSSGAEAAPALAMQLASLASKVPSSKGTPPVTAFPWSDQQAAEAVQASAVCPAE